MKASGFLSIVLVVSLSASQVVACKKKPAPDATAPMLVVKDDSPHLLLSWLDESGKFHVEMNVADVPQEHRERVKVVDTEVDEGATGDRIVIVDLRTKKDDGTYHVRFAPRAELDDLALERRKKLGPTLADTPPAPSAPSPGSPGAGDTDPAKPGIEPGPAAAARPAVIIYGASWCGACHEAAAYCKRRGISFIEKDIEADPKAAAEMQAKLKKIGQRGGSIPVIDVRGKVMVGFAARELEKALGEVL
jgi:glutaredoxin